MPNVPNLQTKKYLSQTLAPAAVVFDEENPRSLVNLLPDTVATRVKILGRSDQRELLLMNEFNLEKELRRQKRAPVPMENILRQRFWIEYNRCQEENAPKMQITHIYPGLCTHEYFYEKLIHDPYILAWVLCPPTLFSALLDESLAFSIIKLREYLALPNTTSSGLPNLALAKFKVTLFKLLDERARGIVPVKNKGGRPKKSDYKDTLDTVENDVVLTLEERLQRLEAKEKKLGLK